MLYKLYYFNVRLLGDPARIMLTAAGAKFKEITWSMDQWPEWKKKSPAGKAPWLEVDGHVIPESFAIYRFLGKRLGFYGKDDFENAIIDATADIVKDTRTMARPYFVVRAGFVPGDADKLLVEHFWPAMENAFPYIKKVLDESGSGFIAASGLTWVDFWISEAINMYRDLQPEFSNKYPWTTEYVERVHGDPRIKDYVQSRKNVRISYINDPIKE